MESGIHSSISSICRNNEYMVVIDPALKENNGYLRSAPLLYALSPYTEISIQSWEAGNNCLYPVNIMGSLVSFGLIGNPLENNKLSIIAISEQKDAEEPYVFKYVEQKNAPRIFLSPFPDYVPNGWPLGDRSIEDDTVIITLTFDKLYDKYLKNSHLWEFKLRETKNIAMVELGYRANLLTGTKIHSIFDIFDYYRPEFAFSPIWDIAADIINLRYKNKVADWSIFVFNCLRPWIERNSDVEKLRDIILKKLNEARYDLKTLYEQRQNLFIESGQKIPVNINPLQPHFKQINNEYLKV